MPSAPPPLGAPRSRRFDADDSRALVDSLTELQASLTGGLDPVARAILADKARTARELASAGAFTEVAAVVEALERGVGPGGAIADLSPLRLALSLSLAALRVEIAAMASARPSIEANVLLVSEDKALVEEVGAALAGSAFNLLLASDEAVARVCMEDAHVVLFHAPEPDLCVPRVQRLRARLKLPPFAYVVDEATMGARAAAARAGASLFLSRPLGPLGIVASARQLMTLRDAEPSRVLLLDLDEERAEAITAAFAARGLTTTRILDVDDLEESLRGLAPDALMIGGPLPILSPADLCRIVRANPAWQSLPIFVALGEDDARARVKTIEEGADDVAARWLPAELAVRVRARSRHARMLREHASYDGVSGLLARGAFLDAAGAHLVEARRAWRALSIGMVRIEDGDQPPDATMVTRFAALLYGHFPAPSLLARWSPREVVVLCTGDRAANMPAELEDARMRLDRDFLWRRPPSVRFAVATMPEDGITLPALLREAAARL